MRTIGVPTVVDAATLVNDALDSMCTAMLAATSEDSPFYSMLAGMQSDERYRMIREVIEPGNMFVTPKEVDATIIRLAKIIADMLNIALHPGVTTDDIGRYL